MKNKILSALAILVFASTGVPLIASAQSTQVDISACAIDLSTATHDQLTLCLISLLSELVVLEQEQAQNTVPTTGQIGTATSTQSVSSTAPNYTPPVVAQTTIPVTTVTNNDTVTATVAPPATPVMIVAQNPAFVGATYSLSNPDNFSLSDAEIASFLVTNSSTVQINVGPQIGVNALMENVLARNGGAYSQIFIRPKQGTVLQLGGGVTVAPGATVEIDILADIRQTAIGTYDSLVDFCGAGAFSMLVPTYTVQDSSGNVLNENDTCGNIVSGQTITITD